MSLSNIMGLLGGLALFLYGMQMMSNGLEQTARNQMRDILKKITSNRITGVLTGALITAVIQSSSATTFMVVGVFNSVIMSDTTIEENVIVNKAILAENVFVEKNTVIGDNKEIVVIGKGEIVKSNAVK